MLYLNFNPPVTCSETCFVLNPFVTSKSSPRQTIRKHLNFSPREASLVRGPGGTQGMSTQPQMVAEHCVMSLLLPAHPVPHSQKWLSCLSLSLAASEIIFGEFNYLCQREWDSESLCTSLSTLSARVPQARLLRWQQWPSGQPSSSSPTSGLQTHTSAHQRPEGMPANFSCSYDYLWEGEARKQRVCAQPGSIDWEEMCSLQIHIEGTGLREIWSVGRHSCGI